MPERCDLLVIGAGPAGSACAAEAAARGLDVRLLDRADFPRGKPCAAGLTSHALALFDGVADRVIHRSVNVVEIRLTDRVRATWRAPRTVVATTTRRELDSRLLELAGAGGARVETGRGVTRIEQDERGVTVVRGTDRIRAAYAVVAEGAAGRLREQLGMPPLARAGGAYVRVVPRSQAAFDELAKSVLLDMRRRRRGYGWVFPKRDHLNVGVFGPEPLDASYLSDLRLFVESLRLDPRRVEGPFAGFVPRASRARDLGSGRVLSAGDAAGFASAISGEGISHAVLGGRIAARVISDGFVDDAERTTVLGRYRALVARDVLPHTRLFGIPGRCLYALGPGFIGAVLSCRPLAASAERWLPTSWYGLGGSLDVRVERG